MSPEQCRAARAWLNWSMDGLAKHASVSNSTIRDFEAGRRVPIANNLTAMRRAFENQKIEFLFGANGAPKGIAGPVTAAPETKRPSQEELLRRPRPRGRKVASPKRRSA